jgi:kynurenine 3-monooxygenase
MSEQVTLIGGGLAGSLLAIYLARHGFGIQVYERRPDMRGGQVDRGRSINLALSTRGIHALKEVGLHDDVMRIAIPMRGRMIHALYGEQTLQRYGRDDSEVIYATSRSQLNITLLDAAASHPNVTLHFNARCTGMDLDSGEVTLRDETTRRESITRCPVVIGTDGSASAVRLDMQKTGRFNFSQQYLEYGYKELTIPAGPGGRFLLEKHALHIWPRGTYMLIALPNMDGSFTATFFFPFEGPESFESLDTEDKVAAFFREQFPDVVLVMPSLLEDYSANPTGSMVTIKCSPWHHGGRALLLGDAAHAIVPFFGQGMNCAFEDCTVLHELIGAALAQRPGGLDWEEMFRAFERLRKENTDAIADLAVENFVEMRDHVAQPKFQLKKKVEQALQERFPDTFIPKYSMVTFHRIPYAVALSRGKVQDRLLDELCASIERVEDLDWPLAERLVRTGLTPM